MIRKQERGEQRAWGETNDLLLATASSESSHWLWRTAAKLWHAEGPRWGESSCRLFTMAFTEGFPGGSVIKNPPADAGDARDTASIPGSERSRSSILTWEIPWTNKPGGLQSMGSQRIKHNWPCTYTGFINSQIGRERFFKKSQRHCFWICLWKDTGVLREGWGWWWGNLERTLVLGYHLVGVCDSWVREVQPWAVAVLWEWF